MDIYSWHAPGWPEPRLAVIISEVSRVANKPQVNVLLCSSQQAARAAGPTEVILDKGDGLDWATLCECDLIYSVDFFPVVPGNCLVQFIRSLTALAATKPIRHLWPQSL